MTTNKYVESQMETEWTMENYMEHKAENEMATVVCDVYLSHPILQCLEVSETIRVAIV